jgi:hypothetical protein
VTLYHQLNHFQTSVNFCRFYYKKLQNVSFFKCVSESNFLKWVSESNFFKCVSESNFLMWVSESNFFKCQ